MKRSLAGAQTVLVPGYPLWHEGPSLAHPPRARRRSGGRARRLLCRAAVRTVAVARAAAAHPSRPTRLGGCCEQTAGSLVESARLSCVPEPASPAEPTPVALGCAGSAAQRRRTRRLALAPARREQERPALDDPERRPDRSLAPAAQQGSKTADARTGEHGEAEEPRRAPARVATRAAANLAAEPRVREPLGRD